MDGKIEEGGEGLMEELLKLGIWSYLPICATKTMGQTKKKQVNKNYGCVYVYICAVMIS